jgi:glycosyltransferase involved in cell wall biosynthesis
MKKIAFISVNGTTPWGASEELWSQTALKMAQLGYRVGANVKGWATKPQPMQNLEQFCKVEYRGYDQTLLQKAVLIATRGRLFYKWLDRFCPDFVVISQSGNNDGLLWMEACIERGIPYITISHVAAENYWLPDEPAARLAIGFAQARKNYFVSQDNIDLTIEQIGEDIPNAAIVRNPYKVLHTAIVPWTSTEQGFKLACVGRIHPTSKGQDLILEVMRQEKWRNRPITVTFYGTGDHEQILRKLAKLWNVQNVEFGGFLNGVEAIWERHHALVLPSRYEGVPLVTLEAMLCGRVCIVTNIAGTKEFVEDNINGFAIKAPTAEFLDEAKGS